MKISDLLNQNQIIPALKGKTKEEIIIELVDSFKQNDKITDAGKIKAAILQREKIMSTGIGKNFAIPHCSTDAVEGLVVAFGKTVNPVEFNSIDDEPVRFVFLFASNDSFNSQHLQLLSQIGSLINDNNFRDGIIKASTSEEILNLFKTTGGL